VAIEQLLPAEAVRPRWSSESALVYIGAVVALFATTSLLGILGEDHGNAALAGFSALATATALVLALALQRAGRLVAAGVLATLAVVLCRLRRSLKTRSASSTTSATTTGSRGGWCSSS
jgi:hypothetical protein